MNSRKIVNALAYDAVIAFEADVTSGIVETDIIGSDGTNYTKKAGLCALCAE